MVEKKFPIGYCNSLAYYHHSFSVFILYVLCYSYKQRPIFYTKFNVNYQFTC